MIDAKIIGDRIKALRRERGLTQGRFAESLLVSFQAVSNWERGVAPPDLENLVRIASFFGVLVDDLLRAEGDGLFLGIDGGGTKTEFAVVNSEGHLVKQILKSGCNPNDIGFPQTLSLICEGIREALVELPTIKAVFCGIAGITAGNHRERLYAELTKRYPQLQFQVKNDASNLFALDDHAEMVVISGTGSVVFALQEDQPVRLGGWGHLLDRAGSAYDMGRDAIRIALAEEDQKMPPSILATLLRERMGTATVWENVSRIYSEGKPYVAGLAATVFDAYRLGDEKAVAIVDDSAKALANLLNKGVELYGVKPVAVASGGIFEHYGEIMTAHIQKYSDVTLTIHDLPPVYGACRSACKLAGRTMGEDFAANFQKTYIGGAV